MKIKITEIVLSLRFAGFGGPAIPIGSRSVVLWDTQPVVIKVAEIHLGRSITRVSAKTEEVERFGKVLANATALEIQNAQIIGSRGKAAIGRSTQPIEGRSSIWPRAHPARKKNPRFIIAAGFPCRASFKKIL